MDCQAARERFSEHLEGALHPLLRAELERHLVLCDGCRELRGAFADVVESLRQAPALELRDAPAGLAERAATAALAAHAGPAAPEGRLVHARGLGLDARLVHAPGQRLEVRPAIVLPRWLHAAAAGFSLIALGTALAVIGPERGTRAAQRLVGETVTAGSSLIERKDRLIEDVRILGVVLSTAFEGRVDRVNERVNDYKRLLERRKADPAAEPKQGRDAGAALTQLAGAFRTGPLSGS